MTDVSRAAHLTWCKQRAIEAMEYSGNPTDALASMMSDLGKHPETQGHAGMELGLMLAATGHLSSDREMRDFIDGFN